MISSNLETGRPTFPEDKSEKTGDGCEGSEFCGSGKEVLFGDPSVMRSANVFMPLYSN